VNELGPFLGIKSVIPAMRESGGGAIINISSVDGVFVSPLTAAYAASKFHLRGLGKSAAIELGEFGIRVNTVCPAAGNPEMVFDAMPAEIRTAFAGIDTSNYADQYPTPRSAGTASLWTWPRCACSWPLMTQSRERC